MDVSCGRLCLSDMQNKVLYTAYKNVDAWWVPYLGSCLPRCQVTLHEPPRQARASSMNSQMVHRLRQEVESERFPYGSACTPCRRKARRVQLVLVPWRVE